MRVGSAVLSLLIIAACTPGAVRDASRTSATDPSSDEPSIAQASVPLTSAPPDGSPEAVVALAGREFLSTSVTRHGKDVLIRGTRVWMTFGTAEVDVSPGCNHFSGPYELIDGLLVVEGLGGTEMACEDRRHAQDDLLTTFLTSRPNIRLEGPRLTLRTRAMAMALLDREVAEPDLPLAGPTWTVNAIRHGEGVMSVPEEPTATIRFSRDGSVAIDTGCNEGSGRYVIEADAKTLTFEHVVFTDRVCTGDARDLEADTMRVIRSPGLTFGIDHDGLTLDGGQVGLRLRGR